VTLGSSLNDVTQLLTIFNAILPLFLAIRRHKIKDPSSCGRDKSLESNIPSERLPTRPVFFTLDAEMAIVGGPHWFEMAPSVALAL